VRRGRPTALVRIRQKPGRMGVGIGTSLISVGIRRKPRLLAGHVHTYLRRTDMKKLLMILLLAGTFLKVQPEIAGQLSIRIGPPPAPRVIHTVPPQPGPDYQWIEGYWYADAHHWRWHDGYWTRAPYDGANWNAPRYDDGHFYAGYWDGDHG